ncbi:SDR family oxidoreductase [Leptospira bouyouniensis]|nr:SDR family oxidoreductase [Leptospira bouyouniensis]
MGIYGKFKMKHIAIVTGASRGIGLAISQILLSLNYVVYGVCRNPENCNYHHPEFHLLKGDLSNPNTIPNFLNQIPNIDNISILVNNAGFSHFAPIEEFSPNKITEMTQVLLTSPMLLTNSLTRILKKNEGRIFFIGSISGIEISPWGNVYASLKAGLHQFARLLFDELRKYSVKVHLVIPDITKTEFYEQLNIEPDADPKSFLLPEQIANVIKFILTDSAGQVIPEILVRPEVFKIKRKKFEK